MTDFDRTKPLYRLFEMEDGARQWWTVEADNTPGRRCAQHEIDLIQAYIGQAEWGDAFYAAFEKHRKATVYAQVVPPYEVPEGCDAVIRGRIIPWGGEKIAIGSIYGDRLQRWMDGHSIHTSNIVSGPDANGVIRTRNSTYKLITPDV